MACPRTQRNFARPGIEPTTFWFTAQLPNCSAIWPVLSSAQKKKRLVSRQDIPSDHRFAVHQGRRSPAENQKDPRRWALLRLCWHAKPYIPMSGFCSCTTDPQAVELFTSKPTVFVLEVGGRERKKGYTAWGGCGTGGGTPMRRLFTFGSGIRV